MPSPTRVPLKVNLSTNTNTENGKPVCTVTWGSGTSLSCPLSPVLAFSAGANHERRECCPSEDGHREQGINSGNWAGATPVRAPKPKHRNSGVEGWTLTKRRVGFSARPRSSGDWGLSARCVSRTRKARRSVSAHCPSNSRTEGERRTPLPRGEKVLTKEVAMVTSKFSS